MSRKIDENGQWLHFTGYSVLSRCLDNFKKIEEHINNTTLSEYYRAVSSYTYHVTVFNIWSHGSSFLPFQIDILKKIYDRLKEDANEDANADANADENENTDPEKWRNAIVHFNFETRGGQCFQEGSDIYGFVPSVYSMYPLLFNAETLCNKYPQNYEAIGEFRQLMSTGRGTLYVKIAIPCYSIRKNLQRLRAQLGKVVGHSDKDLQAHITLAYQYKELPRATSQEFEKIQKDLEGLKDLVNTMMKRIRLEKPRVYTFRDMKTYIPYEWYFTSKFDANMYSRIS